MKVESIDRYGIRFEVTLEPDFKCSLDIVGSIVPMGEEGLDKAVGTVEAKLFLLDRALNERVSATEIFDAISQESLELLEAIWDFDEDQIRENLCSEGYKRDVLYFERLNVKADHRGKDLGLSAMLSTIIAFGTHCGLFVVLPRPLQFDAERQLRTDGGPDAGFETLASDFDLASAKLAAYYSRLGFKPIPGASHYFIDPEFGLESKGISPL